MAENIYLRRSLGFTIIELLVVVAIIGILSALLIAIINPNLQLQKSRDTSRKAILKNIQNALEQYYQDNGSYPSADCWSGSSCWTLSTGSFLGTNASNYLKTLPTDPKQAGASCNTTSSYGIFYDAVGGTSYTLVTRLENTQDTQGQAGTVGTCGWGGSGLSYSVTNQQ